MPLKEASRGYEVFNAKSANLRCCGQCHHWNRPCLCCFNTALHHFPPPNHHPVQFARHTILLTSCCAMWSRGHRQVHEGAPCTTPTATGRSSLDEAVTSTNYSTSNHSQCCVDMKDSVNCDFEISKPLLQLWQVVLRPDAAQEKFIPTANEAMATFS
jgi:hypothetical protein